VIQAVLVLQLGLSILIACAIVAKYLRTRNFGFVILGCGVLLWPLLYGLLRIGIDVMSNRMLHGEHVLFPFSLVKEGRITLGDLLALSSYGSKVIQSGFILVGILMVGRTSSQRHLTSATSDPA